MKKSKTKIESEINKLNSAVNEFASEMKNRLAFMAAFRKRGWETKAIHQLQEQAVKKFSQMPSFTEPEELKKWCEDMANYSMFIHKAVRENRVEEVITEPKQ